MPPETQSALPGQAARNIIYSLIIVPLLAALIYYGARYGLAALLFQTLLRDSSGLSGLALALVLGNLLVAGQFLIAVIATVWLYRLKREPFDGTLLAVVALPVAITVAGLGELVVRGGVVVALALSAAIFVITFWIVDALLKISSTYRLGMRVMAGHKVARGTLFTVLVVVYFVVSPVINVLLSNLVYESKTTSTASQVSYTVLQPTWVPEGMTYDGTFYNEYYTSADDLALRATIVGRDAYSDSGLSLSQALHVCETGRDAFTLADGARCPTSCDLWGDERFSLFGTCVLAGKTAAGDQVYSVRSDGMILNDETFWLARVRGTLVGIDPVNINSPWNEGNIVVTGADIIKLVDGLKEVPKDQIPFR